MSCYLKYLCLFLFLVGYPTIALADSLSFIQTDKERYLKGETIWLRVHESTPSSLGKVFYLDLKDRKGKSFLRQRLRRNSSKIIEGSLFLNEDLAAGPYNLCLSDSKSVLCQQRILLFEHRPSLYRTTLQMAQTHHYAGQTMTAYFRVCDRSGKAVEGAPVTYFAQFAEQEIVGTAPNTDADGYSVVSFGIPPNAKKSGFLAVGSTLKKEQILAHQYFQLVDKEMRIDFFPRGSTTQAGKQCAMAIQARNSFGYPIRARGEILGKDGEVVGTWKTDSDGVGYLSSVIPIDHKLQVKEPLGVDSQFVVPQADSEFGLKTTIDDDVIKVCVRNQASKKLELALLVKGVKRESRLLDFQGKSSLTVEWKNREGLEYADVVLLCDGAVVALEPVVIGAQVDTHIEMKLRTANHFLGEQVEVELLATYRGAPIEADLAISVANSGAFVHGKQSGPLPLSLLYQNVPELLKYKKSNLLEEGGLAWRALTTRLWIERGMTSLPINLDKKATLVRQLERVRQSQVKKKKQAEQAAEVEHGPKKVAGTLVDTPLLKLLKSAPFIVNKKRGKTGNRIFQRDLSAKKRAETPGHGKKAKRQPQKIKVSRSQNDNRDTVYWSGRVRTNKNGRATIRFRLNHEVDSLYVSAHGFPLSKEKKQPLSRIVSLKPKPFFSSQSSFPTILRIGDVVTLPINISAHGRATDFLDVRLETPRCLKLIGPKKFRVAGHQNSNVHFRFHVVEEKANARLTLKIIPTRKGGRSAMGTKMRKNWGFVQEITEHPFSVQNSNLRVAEGKVGCSNGVQMIRVKKSADMIPGSLKVFAKLSPTVVSVSLGGVEGMLREPHGCFEQLTAINYPNLEILNHLKKDKSQGLILANASKLAMRGYHQVLQHQSGDGSFRLFSSSTGDPKCTAMGVAQLSIYRKLFNGLGTPALKKALKWLSQAKLSKNVELYVNFALSEADQAPKKLDHLLKRKIKSHYERALLANICFRSRDPKAKERLATLIKELAEAQGNGECISSSGSGIMGSVSLELTQETTALAALAFFRAGEVERARLAASYLMAQRQLSGSWSGTQATALAIKALTEIQEDKTVEKMGLSLKAQNKAYSQARQGSSDAQIRAGWSVKEIQDDFDLLLDIQCETKVSYILGYSYETKKEKSAESAPYTILVNVPTKLSVGNDGRMTVSIQRVKNRKTKGQIVARIPLPAGVVIEGLSSSLIGTGIGDAEIQSGSLVLYWETPFETQNLQFNLKSTFAGSFSAPAPVVYPYYQPSRKGFGKTWKIRCR